jgi:methyl-accepting chemotaxis protein
MNIKRLRILCFLIPLCVLVPALFCVFQVTKDIILLTQIGLSVIIFLVLFFLFLRPYKKTLERLKNQETTGAPGFTDIMNNCIEMGKLFEQQELERRVSSLNEQAKDRVDRARSELHLLKSRVDNSLTPILKIFYAKENDTSIIGRMSLIVRELFESIETIVSKMKNQSELLALTFDAFDTTTMSLEQVDTIIEKAKGLSSHLQKETGRGREALIQTRESMKAILDSAGKMVRIITTIEDISEQTNILSINASIESTHADRGGKGFSVISKEIRKLANSTKTSSLEIRQMIEDMIQKTKKQSELVDIVFNIFTQINSYIEETNETNKNIYNISKKGVIQGREMQTAINALSAVAREIISSSDKELLQANEVLQIMGSLTKIFDDHQADQEFQRLVEEQHQPQYEGREYGT